MSKPKPVRRNTKSGRFTVGREAFGKISAVEGLNMSKTMQSDFLSLDKQGASARTRREMLAAKYGK